LIKLRFRNGAALREPLTLALLFLEHDYSYRTYDSAPVRADAEWRREDAQIANRIGARMSSREIDALMGRKADIEKALKRISGDMSLADLDEEIPWDALHDLYVAVGGISGIGLAKATKALHKKRPNLIPMLDSVVAGYLRSVDQIPIGDFADEALGLIRSYKVDLDANADTLVSVQHGLNEQGYTLSLCRILDLYTWAYTGEKPPPWAAEAAERLISRSSSPPIQAAAAVAGIDEGAVQGLTEEEQALLKLFGEFWDRLSALPQLHPSDLDEAAFHLHALARIVGMRAAHRAHPDLIPNRSGTPI
jgi:Family of unknown function (DUF6308)